MKFINKYYTGTWILILVLSFWYAYSIFWVCPELLIPFAPCKSEWGVIIAFSIIASIIYNLIYTVIYFIKRKTK